MLAVSENSCERQYKRSSPAESVANLERSAVEAALDAKGFTLEERDHRYYFLFVDGKRTGIYTKVSTGTNYRTLRDPLVALMAKQLKLTAKQFRELVECKLTAGGYVEILRGQGLNL